MVKKILIILTFIIIVSCKNEVLSVDSEKGALDYGNYLATLISGLDVVEFTSEFAEFPNDETIKNISSMGFIYERTPKDIITSMKNYGLVYRRVFAREYEGSVISYLPKDGSYFDMSVTFRKYKTTSIAQIRYSNLENTVVNSVEFVCIYQSGKWKLFTINFLSI